MLIMVQQTYFKNHLQERAHRQWQQKVYQESCKPQDSRGTTKEEETLWNLPGKGLGHRYHLCPGHKEFHLSPCLRVGNRLCSQPLCRTICTGPSSKLESRNMTLGDLVPATACLLPLLPPSALTSAVLGDPAHGGEHTIDVKVFPIEVSTLLLSEVPLLLKTRLRVAGFKFHSAPNTVLATVFWPEKIYRTYTLYSNVFLHLALSTS